MTGKECKKICSKIIATSTTDCLVPLTLTSTPVTLYGCNPVGDSPETHDEVWKFYQEPEDFQYTKNKFVSRDEKEVRQLLSETFLWLSGMGEYPKILAEICSSNLIGDVQEIEDAEELVKIQEKAIAQVLRWVLGEI